MAEESEWTPSPSNFLMTLRDTAGRAAERLEGAIAEAREFLAEAEAVHARLERIADDAEDAAQLVAASDIEPTSSALVPERSGLIRPGEETR
jgi:hypothetical protein